MRRIYEIMLSNACNARCAYCYEDTKRIETMDCETQEATIRFIGEQTDEYDDVVVVWFGGEPLLFPRTISELQTRIVETLESKRVRLTTKLITNGAKILEKDSLQLFASGQIDIVQVSMDGFDFEHINRKRYVDKDVTFDLLVEAIERLLAMGIIVNIRINLGRSNLESCAQLFRYCASRFGSYENFRMHPAILYGPWANEALDYLGPHEIEGAIRQVIGSAYKVRKRMCFSRSCFTGYKTYVIDPCGHLYPCEHFLGVNEFELGVVTNTSLVENGNLQDICEHCANLPTCHQGCSNTSVDSPVDSYCWRREVCS